MDTGVKQIKGKYTTKEKSKSLKTTSEGKESEPKEKR
jgi:hypothetical protein